MPTIFIIERAPDGDVPRRFTGMDMDTVHAQMAELTSNPYDVVDQATYVAAVGEAQEDKS